MVKGKSVEIKTAIDSFRQSLQKFGELQDAYGSPEMDMAYDLLVKDFNHWFGEKTYDWTHAPLRGVNLAKAIKKYCHPDTNRCPICGQVMMTKTNRKTGSQFLGCPSYPECQGTRNRDGTINVNRNLREYLIGMMEGNKKPVSEPDRFQFLETEDE